MSRPAQVVLFGALGRGASVAANLAEGCGRSGDAEFARYCSIAMGSASEGEYHLLLARDLKLLKPGEYEELAPRATELKRMLTALLQKLTADRWSLKACAFNI